MKQLLAAFLLATFSLLAQAQNRGLPDFTELVEKQGPAVVNISTTQTARSSGRGGQPFPFDENDPMNEFFRRFIPRQPGMPGFPVAPRDFESRSLGSGFVVSADGYILTNAHVVDSADEILVRLTDKRELKARVIGTDKRTDVALIKIEATGLPTVRLGDPGALKVGEWVVAIGSPFGFDNSVTAGIVSAKGRSLPQENYVPFIQTDAAVNPGNSGGPLFNLKGEVVGMNSQIYSRSGGFMGISFAIPIDVAMEVQAQLRASGKVSRGRIGIVIQEVNKDLADSFGLSKAQGAAVNAVEKGGPAEKAGIEPGDVILKFDGKAIVNSSDLPRIVGSTRPGSRVMVQVWRKGSSRDLSGPRDFPVPNAAMNWLEYAAPRWTILAWADRRHLERTLDEDGRQPFAVREFLVVVDAMRITGDGAVEEHLGRGDGPGRGRQLHALADVLVVAGLRCIHCSSPRER